MSGPVTQDAPHSSGAPQLQRGWGAGAETTSLATAATFFQRAIKEQRPWAGSRGDEPREPRRRRGKSQHVSALLLRVGPGGLPLGRGHCSSAATDPRGPRAQLPSRCREMKGKGEGGVPPPKPGPNSTSPCRGSPGGGVPPQLGSGPPLRVPPPAARACRPPGAPPTPAPASPLHCGPTQPLPDLSRGSEHLPGQQPDRPPDLPPLPLSSSGKRHIILSGTRAKSPETTAAWLGSPTLRSGPAPHTAAEPPRKHRSDAALPGPGASPGSKSLEAEDAEPPPCPLMPAPPAPLGCSHTGALGRPLAKQSSRARLKIQNRPLAGKLLFIPHDPTHRAQPTKHQGRLVTLLLCPACPRYLFLPHSHHLLPQKESRDHIRPVNLSSTLTPGDLP